MLRSVAPNIALKTAVASLARVYRVGTPLTDPLSILVWDNIGYLIDDERRGALFAEFKKKIGLSAHLIANAPMLVLTDIAKRGGMHPQKRAGRILEIGRLSIAECDGDMMRVLNALPLPKARALLKKFPSIGDPGADKILLFTGIAPQPSIDSNGMRALLRLGYCAEHKNYSQTYKAAVAALAGASTDAEWLKRAYVVLREHGKALCKRATPICEPCPLDPICAHAAIASGI